jgi:hypothetical protein
MKWLAVSLLMFSFGAQATCMFYEMEEAQCSAGGGAGGPKIVQKGPDKCPGKNAARCQNQNYVVNGQSYTPQLKVDHQGNTDWCGYVKCSAPGGNPGGSTTAVPVQIKQDRMQ